GMAAEAGNPVTLELTPSGAEETAVTMTATLEEDGKSLYLFEADGLNLWQGTGTYNYTLYIGRDGSGSENRDDLVSRGSLTLEEGMNLLATSLADFTLFAPDITGQWYSLNDETDLNPDYEVMEVVADITDEGAFTVYARRHVLPDEATDPNFSSNVPADEFLPLLEGTWSLNGYELTATITRADILTLAVLTGDLDDAYYAQYDLGSVGLLTEAEINTLLTYAVLIYPDLEINVDAEALAGIFDTYTQEVFDVNATATGDGSSVTGYAATVELTYTTGETLNRTYTLLDSWLATDLGNEEFRAPLSFPE
ncbi:MAG: hypothetical protein JXA95_03395, partial [Spirochaetales bacterium]|nr:hypothetical protein [Spirochaetales bacterium]